MVHFAHCYHANVIKITIAMDMHQVLEVLQSAKKAIVQNNKSLQ
jgi:hypothetical protein